MIQQFIDSWDLFHAGYVEGWLIGLLLSMIGVIVVARDQIFVGAAVSQASTLGIALALCLAGLLPVHEHGPGDNMTDTWIHSDSFESTMAVLFSVLAALVTAQSGLIRHESHEAVTGWVFLISSSLSVLIVAHSPIGLEQVHRLHSSSIIGATFVDNMVFCVLTVLTVVGVLVFHRRLLLFSLDPPMAAAVGMRTTVWGVAIALWLGLSVGLSIRSSGMLYTFGTLVLPALLAKNLCREVRPMFLVSPAIMLVTSLVGFIWANYFDYPPAQMTVALLSTLLLLAWLTKWLRRSMAVPRE